MLRQSKKILRETLARPRESGWFAFDRNPIEWIECRERFTPLIRYPYRGFFFSHQEDEGEKVARFLGKIEKVLEVAPSSFANTNRFYATWIAPSDFWMGCRMRLSLLTILLRAGTHFNPQKDNFEQVLYAHPYIQQTKDAVERFLSGFTQFVPPCRNHHYGWVMTFEDQSPEQICEQLVLPETKG